MKTKAKKTAERKKMTDKEFLAQIAKNAADKDLFPEKTARAKEILKNIKFKAEDGNSLWNS